MTNQIHLDINLVFFIYHPPAQIILFATKNNAIKNAYPSIQEVAEIEGAFVRAIDSAIDVYSIGYDDK